MKKYSLSSLSIRRKIWVAIALVSLLPFIVFINYFYVRNIYISLPAKLILILIIFLGWKIIFEIFSSIIKTHIKTKKTLESIGVEPINLPNEVEGIEYLLNTLSSKVKDNFVQLEEISRKTENLNKQISKKLFVLSTILQANSLVSKGSPSEEVVQFLIKRLEEILVLKLCCCAIRRNLDELKPIVCLGVDTLTFEKILKEEKNFLFSLKEIKVLNKDNSCIYLKFSNEFLANSFAICPLYSKGQYLGVLIIGVNDYIMDLDEEKETILSLFSQNIAIILEHNRLLEKIEELEIIDYLTGLYNERYIKIRLEEEINRSIIYQRPCGFILLEVKDYEAYKEQFGLVETEKLFKKVAKAFKENLRPIDIAGRFGLNKLSAIVIEKNKKQLQQLIIDLKEKLDILFKDKISINYSIAEIPIDGINSQEIISFGFKELGLKS